MSPRRFVWVSHLIAVGFAVMASSCGSAESTADTVELAIEADATDVLVDADDGWADAGADTKDVGVANPCPADEDAVIDGASCEGFEGSVCVSMVRCAEWCAREAPCTCEAGAWSCSSKPCVDAMGENFCPCSQDADCEEGPCLESPDGLVCSPIDVCGGGSLYDDWITIGYTIVHRAPRLCDPCTSSTQCVATQSDGACVRYGDAGSFCGIPCKAKSNTCPQSYTCSEMPLVEGDLSWQCVKVGTAPAKVGECACSKAATARAASTTCQRTTVVAGAEATCTAIRTCTGPMLQPCSAPLAVTEVCDQVDNDCNGGVDDGICDDGLPCTFDICSASGCNASFAPELACDDANPCTLDDCELASGCAHKQLDGVACDDGLPCTGDGLCAAGVCAKPNPPTWVAPIAVPSPFGAGYWRIFGVDGGDTLAAGGGAGPGVSYSTPSKTVVMRIDGAGKLIWLHTLDPLPNASYGLVAFDRRPNDHMVLIGTTKSDASLPAKTWLLDLDAAGKPTAETQLLNARPNAIAVDAVGDVLVVSNVSNPAYDAHVTATRAGSAGATKWQVTGPYAASASAALADGAGGFAVAGHWYDKNIVYPAMFWRLDANGATVVAGKITTKAVPSHLADPQLVSVNAGYMLIGKIYYTAQPSNDNIWMVRVDAVGQPTWSKKVSIPGLTDIRDMRGIGDDRLLLTGTYHTTSALQIRPMVAALSMTGVALWTRIYGPESGLVGADVRAFTGGPNAGLTFLARPGASVGPPATTTLMVRTDRWGRIDCGEVAACAAVVPIDCHDGDADTTDTCEPKSGCLHTLIGP